MCLHSATLHADLHDIHTVIIHDYIIIIIIIIIIVVVIIIIIIVIIVIMIPYMINSSQLIFSFVFVSF